MKYRWIVSSADQGERLVNFIHKRLGDGFSKRQIKAILDQRGCLINGKIYKHASKRVAIGERIEFSGEVSLPRKCWWKDRILFQDDQLVVLNKPSGITSDSKETLEDLKSEWSDLILVHRLDRDTTGVWLFVRGEKTEHFVSGLFRERKVKKHYFALVDGVPKLGAGSINLPILRCSDSDQNRWMTDPKGRFAHTDWSVEKRGKAITLLSCYPTTGRTHQIRLHCKGIGHPVLGDYRYTRHFSSDYHPARQLLHAYSLTLEHPESGNLMTFTTPIPSDMEKIVEKMRS